jgi:hypothetical protein
MEFNSFGEIMFYDSGYILFKVKLESTTEHVKLE